MATFSKVEVVQRVNHYLESHQSTEMTIEIVERLVRTNGDCVVCANPPHNA